MKKFWKKTVVLSLAILMLISLCGCNALDDLREAQAIMESDGTIVWNGVTYKMIPDGTLLCPELDYTNTVNVTAPGVPVLASLFESQISANTTKDKKLLVYTDAYGFTGYYCREADYDALVARLSGEFVPDLVCFFYSEMDEEGEYQKKYYKLSDAQLQALTTILTTVEPKLASQVGTPKADLEIYLTECSEDLLLQQERMALARVENQYFLEVFANDDAYLFLVPASYNAVFDEVAKAYEDAMWRFMGALG